MRGQRVCAERTIKAAADCALVRIGLAEQLRLVVRMLARRPYASIRAHKIRYVFAAGIVQPQRPFHISRVDAAPSSGVMLLEVAETFDHERNLDG